MSWVIQQTFTGYLLCARLLEGLTGEQYEHKQAPIRTAALPHACSAAPLPGGQEDQCFLLALGLAWKVGLAWQVLYSFASPKMQSGSSTLPLKQAAPS